MFRPGIAAIWNRFGGESVGWQYRHCLIRNFCRLFFRDRLFLETIDVGMNVGKGYDGRVSLRETKKEAGGAEALKRSHIRSHIRRSVRRDLSLSATVDFGGKNPLSQAISLGPGKVDEVDTRLIGKAIAFIIS